MSQRERQEFPNLRSKLLTILPSDGLFEVANENAITIKTSLTIKLLYKQIQLEPVQSKNGS